MGKLIYSSHEDAIAQKLEIGPILLVDKFRTYEEFLKYVETMGSDLVICGSMTPTEGTDMNKWPIVPVNTQLDMNAHYLAGFSFSDLRDWLCTEINTTFYLKKDGNAEWVNKKFEEIVEEGDGHIRSHREISKYIITNDEAAIIFKLTCGEHVLQHDASKTLSAFQEKPE